MRMVTRTIKTSVIATKCVNTDTMEVVDMTFTLSKVGADEKLIAKNLNKKLKGTDLKLVKILGVAEEVVKFGMTEEEFMSYAKVIA